MALDDLGHIVLRAVRKAGDGTDVESQRRTLGDGVQLPVGLVDVAGEDDVHLPQARTRRDGLDVVVNEIAVLPDHHRVQADAFRDDRNLHILAVHLVQPVLPPLVHPAGDLVRVMFHGLLLGDAVDCVEVLVRHVCAVRLEGVKLRNVASQEDLQRLDVHETGGV